jgi:hypothetical protein
VLACDGGSGFGSSMLGSVARMCRKLFLESGSGGGASMVAPLLLLLLLLSQSQSQSPAVVRGFERGKDEVASQDRGRRMQLPQRSITRV